MPVTDKKIRNVIGISYRKIPQAIKELFRITFTPGALIGFETVLAEKANPAHHQRALAMLRPGSPLRAACGPSRPHSDSKIEAICL